RGDTGMAGHEEFVLDASLAPATRGCCRDRDSTASCPEGCAMSTPTPAADRNLIFGLLALQMDFVTREQLLEAMHACMVQKQTPRGEILSRGGVLEEDDRADLERLVERHIRRHGGQPQASLAALRVEPGLRRDLGRLDDADVRASVAHVGPPAPAAESPVQPPDGSPSVPG